MFDVFKAMEFFVPKVYCKKYRRDGEFIIVCSHRYRFHYLNTTAGEIYLLCNGNNTVSDILYKMMEEYDVPKDVLQEDLIKVIRDFQQKDIITISAKY